MAWKKAYTIEDTGVSGEYWHEMGLMYDMIKGIVVFTYGCWINKTAFDAGKKPIETKWKEIPEGTNPQLATAGKAFLEGYVRALPEFSGSEDA
jgi:hypothetical protein